MGMRFIPSPQSYLRESLEEMEMKLPKKTDNLSTGLTKPTELTELHKLIYVNENRCWAEQFHPGVMCMHWGIETKICFFFGSLLRQEAGWSRLLLWRRRCSSGYMTLIPVQNLLAFCLFALSVLSLPWEAKILGERIKELWKIKYSPLRTHTRTHIHTSSLNNKLSLNLDRGEK